MGKMRQVEDVEYRPHRGIGTLTLVRACIAVAVAVLLFSLGILAVTYAALIPTLLAIAWFAAYAAKRRLRVRLTEAGIESRRLRTRFIPWAQVRDVEVVKPSQGAGPAFSGNRTAGSWGGGPGRGERKVAAVRVQQSNGRWLELAAPVMWENAPDPDFTSKAGVIRDRWQTATGHVPAAGTATPVSPS